jgi:hypothetical protein
MKDIRFYLVALTLILVILKVTGQIHVGWGIVLFPIWAPIAGGILILSLMAILVGVAKFLEFTKNKFSK